VWSSKTLEQASVAYTQKRRSGIKRNAFSKIQTSRLGIENRGRRSIQRQPWSVGRNLGIRAEVNYVNADDAKKLVEAEGYTVLDVRDKTQYERARIKSSYHVPLFIENQDNDLGTIIQRTVHNNFSGLFFGLPFTKPNPQFVESVKSQFSPESSKLLEHLIQKVLWSCKMLGKPDWSQFKARSRRYLELCSFVSVFNPWNLHLCISIHHFLPRPSREVVSIGSA
ncbi:hypothetical protein Tsubulata_034912, partial [Turnera subulata]